MKYINRPTLKVILESDKHSIIYENFDRKELLILIYEMDSLYRKLYKQYKIKEYLDSKKIS